MQGTTTGDITGDTRSLDYSLYWDFQKLRVCMGVFPVMKAIVFLGLQGFRIHDLGFGGEGGHHFLATSISYRQA